MIKGAERLRSIHAAADTMGCNLVSIPYERYVTSAEIDKLIGDYEQGKVSEVVAIVPSRTDTQWWHKMTGYPVCFVTGRLSFDGKSSAPFPTSVFYLGGNLRKFYDNFRQLGVIKICTSS